MPRGPVSKHRLVHLPPVMVVVVVVKHAALFLNKDNDNNDKGSSRASERDDFGARLLGSEGQLHLSLAVGNCRSLDFFVSGSLIYKMELSA